MTLTEESSPAVVALLLDDIAPPRLGTLLRAARKQRGLTRRDVAGRVGTTPGDLRRIERGDMAVPPHLVAELAECYGDDLAAQFATRMPIDVTERRVEVAGTVELAESEDTDEVLHTYVSIVARLRTSEPGTPIALRADDLVALSSALGQNPDRVEARIVELLGCSPHEAHSLHMEMLRRKLVVPVAGLVAGLAVVTGIGMVGMASASPTTNQPAPATATARDTRVVTMAAPVAPKPVATSATAAPAPAPAVETPAVAAPAVAAPAPAPATPETAAPAAPEETVAPAVADVEPVTTPAATPAVTPVKRPVIEPDDTPMSVPANETVTIIQP
jgi:transcriptional regulator with XRE-family HTH domain